MDRLCHVVVRRSTDIGLWNLVTPTFAAPPRPTREHSYTRCVIVLEDRLYDTFSILLSPSACLDTGDLEGEGEGGRAEVYPSLCPHTEWIRSLQLTLDRRVTSGLSPSRIILYLRQRIVNQPARFPAFIY